MALFSSFFYLLKDYGVPISLQYIIEFYEGLKKGIAPDLDRLFTFARLIFVKKLGHMDAFERAFALYFYGIDIPSSTDNLSLFYSKPFQEWLKREIEEGRISREDLYWNLSMQELLKRFWETALKQMEEHHGGGRWIGTGGYSPFGHSGYAQRGIRVYGESRNFSALKVIGERRYVDYSSESTLRAENIRQALEPLKYMVPEGPSTLLNLDETIYRTAKNGGEVELVFERELQDKIKLILLLDNGGYSMDPHIELTKFLFSKVKERFKEVKTYYFHNTIYGEVFLDPPRIKRYKTTNLLGEDPEARFLVVGDASMAPEELMSPYGFIEYDGGIDDKDPSILWLTKLREYFK